MNELSIDIFIIQHNYFKVVESSRWGHTGGSRPKGVIICLKHILYSLSLLPCCHSLMVVLVVNLTTSAIN